MKLIIDIPENLYKATVNGLDANEIWDLRLSVKNGTPLDKISTISIGVDGKAVQIYPNNDVLDEIKVEIEDIAFDWQEIDDEHESFMVVDLNDALRIIDKYKAERSE